MLRIRLPRPRDTTDGGFDAGAWGGYANWLGGFSPEDVWKRYLGIAAPAERDAIWDRSVAPGIAQRIVNGIGLELVVPGESSPTLVVDPSLVSQFAQDRPVTVGLRVDAASIGGWTRAHVAGIRVVAASATPGEARMTVDSAAFRYRTEHLAHTLVSSRRIMNDLAAGDPAELIAPLDRLERRNPRDRDRRLADELLEHLDEQIEHYHRAIWVRMDPNRRYLLLDGFISPDAGGRSVASVVENRIAGVVGNCLVLPLRPGAKLDPTYEFADADDVDLRHLYAGGSAPPMRISLPTRGVFAEAVLGRCNSCEVIDDSRFWRFEEEPIPDTPTAIRSLSTASRRQPAPDLTPDQFPDPLVKLQQAPVATDPTGLAAAMRTLGTEGIFRNLTGLAANQANSAQALKTALTAAQNFATQAGALAQQRYMTRELDRSLAQIKTARDKRLIKPEQAQKLAESAVRGALGEVRPKPASPTTDDAVAGIIRRAGTAAVGGEVRVTRPEGTVEVRTGDAAERWGAPGSALIDQAVFDRRDVEAVQRHAQQWEDLLRYRVPADVAVSLSDRGMRVQTFWDAIGDLNLDRYPVRVKRMPIVDGVRLSPAELLDHVRLHFNNFIDTDLSEFLPYTAGVDDARWAGQHPVGAVFRIDIQGPDNAAVVGTLVEDARWRFATITTPDTGGHPVSGVREWGYLTAPTGDEHVFYTRGADRSTAALETLFSEALTFAKGDQLWRSFQSRLSAFINHPDRDGEAELVEPFSRRFKWTLVNGLLRLPQPV